jgi:hypothetical protein
MILDDLFDEQDQQTQAAPVSLTNPLQSLMERHASLNQQIEKLKNTPAPSLADPEPQDDLEPISTEILRGFFRGGLPNAKTPEFGQIFRQSITPGREFLANLMNGVSASFLGTKFQTVREKAFEQFVTQQKLEQDRQQTRGQLMQGMASLAQHTIQQRGERAVRLAVEKARLADNEQDRAIRIAQAQQTAERWNLDLQKFLTEEDRQNAQMADAGPPLFKAARRIVESRLKLNNVDLNSPAGHNQLMTETVKEWEKLEAAEAKITASNRPAPQPYIFTTTGPDGGFYIGAMDKRSQEIIGGKYIGRKLTAEQIDAVNNLRAASDNVRNALAVAQNSPDALGGFAQQLPPELRARLGALPASERSLRLYMNSAVSSYIQSVSGKAVTDVERKFLTEGLPKVYEKPENFFPGAYAFASMLDAARMRSQYGLEIDLAKPMQTYMTKMQEHIKKTGSAKGLKILSSQEFLDYALKGYGKKLKQGPFGTMELVDAQE